MATKSRLVFLGTWQINYRRSALKTAKPHFMIKVSIRRICPEAFISPRSNDSVIVRLDGCFINAKNKKQMTRYLTDPHIPYWGLALTKESLEEISGESICYSYTLSISSNTLYSQATLSPGYVETKQAETSRLFAGASRYMEAGRMKDCKAMRTTRASRCQRWCGGQSPEMNSKI